LRFKKTSSETIINDDMRRGETSGESREKPHRLRLKSKKQQLQLKMVDTKDLITSVFEMKMNRDIQTYFT
jgi:hypothetical protein